MATEVSFAKTFLAILDKNPSKITADHVEDPRGYPASTPYTLPRPSKPMSKPGSKRKPSSDAAPSSDSTSEPSLTVSIKSPRNPTLELTLPQPQPIATTSMLDIKNLVYEQTCLPVEKLKILYNKKPVADTKTLRDVLSSTESTGEGQESIEFSLMVMGGAATAAAAEEALAAKKRAAAAEQTPQVQEGAGEGAGVQVQVEADGDTVMTTAEEEEPVEPAQVVAEGSGPSGEAVLKTEQFWEDLKGFLQQRIRDEKVAGEVVVKFRGAV